MRQMERAWSWRARSASSLVRVACSAVSTSKNMGGESKRHRRPLMRDRDTRLRGVHGRLQLDSMLLKHARQRFGSRERARRFRSWRRRLLGLALHRTDAGSCAWACSLVRAPAQVARAGVPHRVHARTPRHRESTGLRPLTSDYAPRKASATAQVVLWSVHATDRGTVG